LGSQVVEELLGDVGGVLAAADDEQRLPGAQGALARADAHAPAPGAGARAGRAQDEDLA